MITEKIEHRECKGRGCKGCHLGLVVLEIAADDQAVEALARGREEAARQPLPATPGRKRSGTPRRTISVRAATYQRIQDAGVENVSGWLEDLIAEKLDR